MNNQFIQEVDSYKYFLKNKDFRIFTVLIKINHNYFFCISNFSIFILLNYFLIKWSLFNKLI
jgi:hypothetical protein